MIGLNILTHSRMQCFKACNYRHYVEYELGVRRIVSDGPLRMGSAIHDALDLYAQGLTAVECYEAICRNYAEPPSFVEEREWLTEREIVLRLFTGYVWRWIEADDIKVVSTEKSFCMPIVNPETGRPSRSFKFAGKLDKQIDWSGRPAIMEHKTTSGGIQPDDPYWGRLRIDSQISGYMVASRDGGFDAETVIYDVIRKPGIRPKDKVACVDGDGIKIVVHEETGERALKQNGEPYQSASPRAGRVFKYRPETVAEYGERLTADIYDRPDFYFARREIPRLDADLDEFRRELWMMQNVIRFCRSGGHWPRNTQACSSPFPCPIRQECWDGFDFENETPDGFERVENVHQELGDEYANSTAATED